MHDAPLVSETRAALAALLATLSERVADPVLLLTPLARLGDALRLSIEVPAPLVRWLGGSGHAALSSAALALRDEVATWSLPAVGSVGDDDPELAFVLRRRDEAESVEKALLRVCIAQRTSPAAVEGIAALRATLEAFDARLRDVATRARVEALLGARASLLSARSWTSALDEPAGGEHVADAPSWAHDALEPPPPGVLEQYVSQGVQARYVEGVAARDPEFAAQLAALIAVVREQDPVLSLRALCWQRSHGHTPGAALPPVTLPAVPRLRLAAASSEGGATQRSDWSLGRLEPVPAEARLLCTSQTATLKVYAQPGAIARVEFGAQTASAPGADGVWSVEVAVREDALPLRVVGSEGAVFEVEVRLASLA